MLEKRVVTGGGLIGLFTQDQVYQVYLHLNVTLFGARSKVEALKKLRIPSPNTKKCEVQEARYVHRVS